MRHSYQGPFTYSDKIIRDWNFSIIGVYYCGYKAVSGNLYVLYVGRATGEGGIRERLLQHLNENKWARVTHFGYVACDTAREAEDFEAGEIKRLQPTYNELGK